MNRFAAFFIACALCCGSAVSCSSAGNAAAGDGSSAPGSVSIQESAPRAESSELSPAETDAPADIPGDTDTTTAAAETVSPGESTSAPVTDPTDPQTTTDNDPGGDITGRWLISSSDGLSVGLGFFGGSGSVFVDFSEQLYFSGGSFFVCGKQVDDVTYDGSTLTVGTESSPLMELKRTDSASGSSFDGVYTLVSGAMYDSLVSTVEEQLGIPGGDAEVTFGIDGETFYMSFGDMFTYTVSGNMLAMKGNVDLLGADAGNGSYAEFEINGSSMSFLTNAGELISLSRWGK